MKRAWALAWALAPAAALACPMCAERGDAHRLATYALIAAFISVPYAVGAVVVRLVRGLDEGEL